MLPISIVVLRCGIIVCIFTIFLFSGCSVYMASTKKGTELSKAMKCQTVTCLETKGAKHIKDGKGNIKYYKLRKPTGSTGRAVMHGLLDVATLGAWEVVGTPLEGAYDKENYYGLKVKTGKKNDEKIKNVQIVK